MNKFLAYTVIAILLGSVTMIVPLAMLGPDNLVPADSNHNVLASGEENVERKDPPPDSLATQHPNGTENYDNSSTYFVQEKGLNEADVASGLSSMGLMIVPGFLVALGVFVYLKKRMV